MFLRNGYSKPDRRTFLSSVLNRAFVFALFLSLSSPCFAGTKYEDPAPTSQASFAAILAMALGVQVVQGPVEKLSKISPGLAQGQTPPSLDRVAEANIKPLHSDVSPPEWGGE